MLRCSFLENINLFVDTERKRERESCKLRNEIRCTVLFHTIFALKNSKGLNPIKLNNI